MGNKEFSDLCIKQVAQLLGYSEDEMYISWMCKTLQNNKALVSSTRKYAPYVECTYNGDNDELYIDVYTKQLNRCVNEVHSLLEQRKLTEKEISHESK